MLPTGARVTKTGFRNAIGGGPEKYQPNALKEIRPTPDRKMEEDEKD